MFQTTSQNTYESYDFQSHVPGNVILSLFNRSFTHGPCQKIIVQKFAAVAAQQLPEAILGQRWGVFAQAGSNKQHREVVETCWNHNEPHLAGSLTASESHQQTESRPGTTETDRNSQSSATTSVCPQVRKK